MRANEMREMFKLLFDGAAGYEMGYDDSEVSFFLTTAQRLYVKERLLKDSLVIEETWRKSDFSSEHFDGVMSYVWYKKVGDRWVMEMEDGEIDGVDVGRYDMRGVDSFRLPGDFMSVQSVYVEDDKGLTYNAKYAHYSLLDKYLENDFLKPDSFTVYYTIDGGLRIVHGGKNLRGVRLYYIMIPPIIVVDVQHPENQVDCVLSPFTHEEIVKKAVKLALEGIADTAPTKTQLSIQEDMKGGSMF